MHYFKKLFEYSRPYLPLNVLGLVIALGSIGTGVVLPIVTRTIVDDVLQAQQFDKLGPLITLLLVLAFLRLILIYSRLYIYEYTSQRVVYDIRRDLFAKIQSQSFKFFDKQRTGLLMNRIVGDLNSIQHVLNSGLVQLFESIVTLIVTFSMMFYLNIPLTIALCFVLPFLYINTRSMSKYLRPTFRSIRESFENLTSTVQENITGIQVVKSFGREETEIEQFTEVAQEYTDRHIKAADIRAKYVPFGRFINGVGLTVIIFVGGYLIINHGMTVGTLVAFNAYLLQLNGPINSLNGLVNQVENAIASMEKVFELLDEEPAIKDPEIPATIQKFNGHVKFNNVWFTYEKEPVLRNINLELRPGTVTAIMGDTGSGKSTIINLLARFYDVDQGEITIDGVNVKDYKLDALRKNIGIIMQDTFLFSDTIANNIAFANPNATMDEIEHAAKIAHAHDFIMATPDKYETVIGERGIGLSGGQRQRVSIARAILSDPQILVLDDATSSVDMETEHAIQQTLKEIMPGRTTLIVAHRISTVKDADEIIFLENGAIVERGTHQELMKLRGRYYKTVLQQYRDYYSYFDDDQEQKTAQGGLMEQ